MNDDAKKLNPDIRTVEVGVRETRKITIYPLSFRDQIKASELITEGLQRLMEVQNSPDAVVVGAFIDLLGKNTEKILKLVADKDELGRDIIAELTNNQFLAIGQTIYEVNYEALQKKVQSLFGKRIDPESPLKRQSLQPLEDIRSTDSTTSLGSPSETVE